MLTETEKYQRCYEDERYRCGASRLEVGKRFMDATLIKGDTYLDVGCGRGELIEYALSGGIDACGLELVPELCGGTVVEGQITEMPFLTNAFSVVSCLDVVEHLPTEDVDFALDELFRVARHVVFITTNDRPSQFRGLELHLTRKPKLWWERKLARDGWSLSFENGPPHADWQWTCRAIT